MTTEETVMSWLKDRYVDELWVASSIVKLILLDQSIETVSLPVLELRLYTSARLSNHPSSINISSPSIDPGIVEKAETVAACSLILGTSIKDIQLEPNGILILGFDNGLSLTVLNTSDSVEYSWVICEPQYSENTPKFEVFCSNDVNLDEYKIG